jgi:hypothetical protein
VLLGKTFVRSIFLFLLLNGLHEGERLIGLLEFSLTLGKDLISVLQSIIVNSLKIGFVTSPVFSVGVMLLEQLVLIGEVRSSFVLMVSFLKLDGVSVFSF